MVNHVKTLKNEDKPMKTCENMVHNDKTCADIGQHGKQ